jgi:hypothetical protein
LRSQRIFPAEKKLVTLTFTFHPSAEPKRLKTRYAPDLQAEDIELLDNGIPQPVAVFERTGTEGTHPPIDVILLFDSGRDSRPYMNPRVVNSHVFEELENVRFSIYGFSDATYRLASPTGDMAQLSAAMANLSRVPFVASVAPDAIIQTIQDAVTIPASRPRMLVVFSGFTINGQFQPPHGKPQHSYDEAEGLAKYYDIALFPVVVLPRLPVGWARFAKFGEATGGKQFSVYSVPEGILQEVLEYYKTQARSEYVAGFYPSGSANTAEEPHKIEVRLKSNLGEITGGVRMTEYRNGDSGGEMKPALHLAS